MHISVCLSLYVISCTESGPEEAPNYNGEDASLRTRSRRGSSGSHLRFDWAKNGFVFRTDLYSRREKKENTRVDAELFVRWLRLTRFCLHIHHRHRRQGQRNGAPTRHPLGERESDWPLSPWPFQPAEGHELGWETTETQADHREIKMRVRHYN